MSGLDATRELRRLESLGIIPPQRIIALTGNAREGQIQNALQSGMDEVVVSSFLTFSSPYTYPHPQTKPYRLPELLERIRPT
jgi:CheY-like chemotaxis protein